MDFDLNETSCCGMKELSGIQDFTPDYGFFQEIAEGLRGNTGRTAHIIFTDARLPAWKKPTKGDELAAFIRKKRMGRVTASPWRKNPNSLNEVCVFVWTFNDKMTKLVEQFNKE
jgi:hypothetical protein